MTKRLDRGRPFGWIQGASTGALYHQDGVCFGSDDLEVGAPKEVAYPAPEPAAEPAAEPAGVDTGATREELEALHPSQIKVLVEAEGLTLEKGAGSKARNIDNLLAAG